ncbi:MAG: OmpA family protein [Gammaproteobacteria bacterium]
MNHFQRASPVLAGAIVLAMGPPAAMSANDGQATASRAFEQSLASDYQSLSTAERAAGDGRDADTYAARAAAASSGQATAPDDVSLRREFLKQHYVEELTAARARLMAAFAGTARTDVPTAAARAQTSYDCWLEQASEDLQPDDIAACRQSFMTAMDTLETRATAVAEVVPADAVAATAVAPAAAPVNESYRVFFAFDSAVLDEQAHGVLEQVRRDVEGGAPRRLSVEGHASTVGTQDYNMHLSRRRADAVKAALIAIGINAENIDAQARGEGDQWVETGDGVREPRNRQVFVTILP